MPDPNSTNTDAPTISLDPRDILDNAPIGVFTSTPDGRFLSVNSAFSRLYGYDSPESLIESVTDIARQIYVDPADREAFIRQLETAGSVINHECRFRKRDGTTFWVSRNARAVKDQKGRIVAYQGFTTDITAQKLAEERERESDERFRLMFLNAPMPYQSLDEQGNFLDVNQAFLGVLGYSRDELIGKNFGDILHPDWVDHFKTNFPKFKAVGEVLGVEFEMVKKDGSTILVYFNGKIQQDDQGRFQRTHCIFQDVTEKRQTEEYLRLVLEATNDGIWDYDLVTDTFQCSERFAEMLGYRAEEISQTGCFCEHNIHPEDLDAFQSAFSAYVFGRSSFYAAEFRLKTRQGNYKWIYSRGRALRRDASGRALRIVGAHTDISEQKHSEIALRESEERFRRISENIHEVFWLRSADNKTMLYINPVYERIWGRSCQSLYENPASFLDAVHPEDKGLVLQAFMEEMENKVPFDLEYRIIHPDGAVRWVWARSFPVTDEAGTRVGVAGNAVDITDRKQAEEALRESEQRYREIFNATYEAIFIDDARTGRILDVNEAMLKMYGYPSKEAVLAKNIGELSAPEATYTEEEAQKRIMAAIAGEPQQFDWLARKWSGVTFPVEVTLRHSLIGGQERVIAVVRDITERKRIEQRLLEAKHKAESANRAKSEFLANMSHEIRTPINGIMGMLQLLEITPLDATQKKYAKMAMDSANRLTRLLSDILDLSRVEAGKMEIHPSEFSLHELRDSIIGLFTFTATSKQIDLECSIDPGMPRRLIGDEARVRQVVFNLVGNALKYSDTGKISVEMALLTPRWPNDARVLFSVSDRGIGIAEDRLRDIFEPFQQINGSYTRKYQGAGLGLAIVKRLVDLMGGSISVVSTVGMGTTVHVLLPFTQPTGKSILDYDQPGLPDEIRRGLRILLAEDDPSNALPIRKLLEKKGHTVTVAEDGQQVLDLLKSNAYDCILMDIQMPVLSGIAATKAIRSSTDLGLKKNIPIIALTAYAMSGDREQFLEAGMDDYLAKPVRMEDVEMVLERIVMEGKACPPEARF